MRRMVVEPQGWPCTIRECPAGFFVYDDELCFKTEYKAMDVIGPTNVPGPELRWTVGKHSDVYCDSGERFCGGFTDQDEAENLQVQPVEVEWRED